MPSPAMLSRELSAAISPYRPGGGAYEVDERLDAFVDAVVLTCREHHDSLDDTVETVASLVRTVAPAESADRDPDWEGHWRAYFAFSDHAIMHAIRLYVERGNDQLRAPGSPRRSDAPCAACEPEARATRL